VVGAATTSGYDGKGKSWCVVMTGGEGEQPSTSGVHLSRSNRKTLLELEEAEPAVSDSTLRSSTIERGSVGTSCLPRAPPLAAASGHGGHPGAVGGGHGGHGGGHPKTKGMAAAGFVLRKND